ncbi:unnamed protein product, partial [Tetraodon nigroviridis]
CIHEPRAPSPSLSGFSTPISEPLYRRLDGDTPACTPETDLTPTQCVLRNVLSIDTGGQAVPGGSSPTPSDGPSAHFDNSVLKLHEHEACQCGGGAEAGTARRPAPSGARPRTFGCSREAEVFWRDCLAA